MLLVYYCTADRAFLKGAGGYQDFQPITEQPLQDQIVSGYRPRGQCTAAINSAAIRAELVHVVLAISQERIMGHDCQRFVVVTNGSALEK